jgi:hypothetical protein
METKTIPFKLNLAMMISRGEKEGEIIFKGEDGLTGRFVEVKE